MHVSACACVCSDIGCLETAEPITHILSFLGNTIATFTVNEAAISAQIQRMKNMYTLQYAEVTTWAPWSTAMIYASHHSNLENTVPEMFDWTCSKCRIIIRASIIMKQNKQPIKKVSLG